MDAACRVDVVPVVVEDVRTVQGGYRLGEELFFIITTAMSLDTFMSS